jgi:hypothetical protein
MHLLQFGKDNELNLKEFIGGDVPPYAILSHTWGQDDSEVTYQDIITGAGKKKAGYAKIRRCGQQAVKNGLPYFWVDTCCIDKTSSAQLSEAINSMYHWYQEATICFTYLEDVVGKEFSMSSMAQGRWFSRGWTLQELVASRKMEFYAADWTFLGTKGDYCNDLSSITGIHVGALQYQPVESFGIAQRMSWASGRTTTRPEDIAYCLLGLFNVNMPLLYGEGAKKAFIRLQEEIMKDSDDQSLFAWTQPSAESTTLRGLLADSPANFASSGAIVPVRELKKSHPFSTTNAGLRITLPMTLSRHDILPLEDPKIPFRTGVLNCVAVSENKSKQLVALDLYCIPGEGDQYGRADISKLKYVTPHERGRCSRETIYIRKQTHVKNAFEAAHLEKSNGKEGRWKQRLLFAWQLNVIEEVEVRLP